MLKHVLGFPRVGPRRELKKALEAYWKGVSSSDKLEEACQALRRQRWKTQANAGLSNVVTGDFSLYDHVLDITAMIGAVPTRFGNIDSKVSLDTYFKMARGDSETNAHAMEMSKWFNTNYHYIVPEISGSIEPKLSRRAIIDETREAAAAGFTPKPVLLGPITYLSLAKGVDGFDRWKILDAMIKVYGKVIAELTEWSPWIQLDEPILCADLEPVARKAFRDTYAILNGATGGKAKLLLATYFDVLDENLDLALNAGTAGLHIDLVRGAKQLDAVLADAPKDMVISAGVVDGRNIWKTNLTRALSTLREIEKKVGASRMMVGSSCSLLHVPVDLENERYLDSELKSWMAFATQKCSEISLLGEIMEGVNHFDSLKANLDTVNSRLRNAKLHNPKTRERLAGITPDMTRRKSPYSERKKSWSWLRLPLFPTTTIGSFPQTTEIRKQRKQFRDGDISRSEYDSFLMEEIRDVVKKQEELGLDVLVHGEPERNDMVEYFGQRMEGFCFTENGWTQSYGSRCVKPPIIYGDVSRPNPMTVDWITYADSLTNKPMKGMLTGPVTILCWSFVRDDLSRDAVCQQLALAIRDEVLDLEAAGIRVIQIDEAALSEGMPIKKKDQETYLNWAVESFRLATSGVADSIQIHTHMCYSEFNEIIRAIAAMDADVISVESSRSEMELLNAFRDFEYPNEIGPGVYDIHSPRVPSEAEIVSLLEKALRFIPKERLWVNPDCGLKTRAWPETIASLKNMVAAAKILRKTHAG